jgi:hypothetical protein
MNEGLIHDYHVTCRVCNENLGDYRINFAHEHLEKYPDHNKYDVRVKGKSNY